MLQKKRVIRTGAPIEWHAAKIYTRVMFDKFSGELYASGGFAAVHDEEDEGKYYVRRVVWPDNYGERRAEHCTSEH